MKAVVVREIVALVLKPSAGPSTLFGGSTSVTRQSEHIRFADKTNRANSRRTSGEKDKKGGNAHARYYAAVTFNQVVLTPSDRIVAVTLLDVYFQMFKEILGEKDEREKETGEEGDDDDNDNDDNDELEDNEAPIMKTDKRGRVLDYKKGKKAKAPNLSKGAAGFVEVEDSSSKLISAILTGINRALPFANIDANDSV